MPRLTIEEVVALLATPEPFEAWLTGKEVEEEVGITRSRQGDPLSMFLLERGVIPLDVSESAVRFRGEAFPLEPWARTFNASIDSLPDRRGGKEHQAVTAADAFAILFDAVLRGVAEGSLAAREEVASDVADGA